MRRSAPAGLREPFRRAPSSRPGWASGTSTSWSSRRSRWLVVIFAVAVTRFPTSAEDSGDGEKIERFGFYRNFPLLLVAFVSTLGLLSEGEMEHWSGIYLRQTLEVPALLGASGARLPRCDGHRTPGSR